MCTPYQLLNLFSEFICSCGQYLKWVQIRLKANHMIIFMGVEESLIVRECDKLQLSEYKAHSKII